MNIRLLLDSLSDSERKELRDIFLTQEKKKLQKEINLIDKNMAAEQPRLSGDILIKDVLRENPKLMGRLYNILEKHASEPLKKFNNRHDFMKLTNAGVKCWDELTALLIKYNITIE